MTGFFVSGLLLFGLAAPAWAAPATYEPNRHGYHGDRHRHDREGRWHHDRRYHRDGRYHYRDDNYYRGRPTPDCPSGEWAYHPNTGWMCAG
jgi:hypothetical protein